jgi:hypothetical protein
MTKVTFYEHIEKMKVIEHIELYNSHIFLGGSKLISKKFKKIKICKAHTVIMHDVTVVVHVVLLDDVADVVAAVVTIPRLELLNDAPSM